MKNPRPSRLACPSAGWLAKRLSSNTALIAHPQAFSGQHASDLFAKLIHSLIRLGRNCMRPGRCRSSDLTAPGKSLCAILTPV